jgi:4-amino-4-deoxy-L-arabinose transferase-like glycosyltransferase
VVVASPAVPALRADRRPRGWHLALLGVIVALLPAFAFRNFAMRSIPPWSDYWDYLQLGRQILHGHGFSSLFTYPLFLEYSGNGPFFPLLWRPPLYPLLVSATFLLSGGPSLWAPLALQIAGYVAAVLAAYLLALEFVEPRWALLAACVTALSPHVLCVAEPGIATAAYTAALTFGFLIAVRATTRRRAFWTGLYFGALVLFRAETLILGPAVVWMLWAGERGDRESRIWHFLAGGLLVLVPWTIRTWVVTGRPFSSTSSLLFTDTRAYPGWESSRHLDTLRHSALLWALSHPGDMLLKALRNGYHFLRQALLMPIPALAPFVWAAMARLTRIGRESAFCAALLIGILLFLLILSPLEYAPRFLHPFIPALTVVGIIVLSRFREDLGQVGATVALSKRPAVWAALAVLLLAGLEMIGAIAAVRRERTLPAVLPDNVPWDDVARAVPSGSWGLADYPACYAWHSGARFVWFPVYKDLDRVAHSETGLRTVVLLDNRGEAGPDPTGIPSTRELADSLLARGWSVRGVGPLRVFEEPPAGGAPPVGGARPAPGGSR